ncbi:MAG: glycosyltransferase [Anaerolineales bacterium]|nr:glycosyltransferase [Anaerolineales bacterium]
MTKILYTAFDIVPSPKGASTHILHNLRGLVNGKYDAHLITPNDGLLPTEDTIEGAQVTRISQDLSQNFLARAMHFGRSVSAHLALNQDYDVVHYRNIWDGLSIAQNKKRFGYKTLFEVNGLPSIELKYHYPGLDPELLLKIKEQEIATLHLSDAIICPSNVTRDYIASLGLNRKLVTVIPNGVSASDFSASPLPPATDESLCCYTSVPSPIGRDWTSSSRRCPRSSKNNPSICSLSGAGVPVSARCSPSKFENLASKSM